MPGISIHVVDVSRGLPARGMRVDVMRLEGERAQRIGGGPVTDTGNIDDAALAAGTGVTAGVYEARLAAGAWFRDSGAIVDDPAFLETIVFRFVVSKPDEHYHLPIKLTPWGLSVWRGR